MSKPTFDFTDREIASLPSEVHWCPPRLCAGTSYWPRSPREKVIIERDRKEFAAIVKRLPAGRAGGGYRFGASYGANSAGRTL